MSTNKTRTVLSRRLVLFFFSFMSVRFYCVLVYVECFFLFVRSLFLASVCFVFLPFPDYVETTFFQGSVVYIIVAISSVSQ